MNNQGVHHELIYLPNYGNNNYGILSFKEVVRPQDLPCFQSRYFLHKDIYVFDVTLSPFNIDLPKLVELSLSFLYIYIYIYIYSITSTTKL
ncbi:hypothetical protein RYX36_015069 [Vicia faba]